MSRPKTVDEVRREFLEHVAMLVNYWDQETRANGPRDRLEGLAFSIMTMLDGCSMAVPGYQVVASTHSSDRQYHEERGENIAGTLHEQIYSFLEKTR